MSQSTVEYIEETRKWLRAHNDAYKAALEKLSNPAFVRKLFRSIEAGLMPVLSYNPREERPEVAVFGCGVVQAKIEGLLTDFEFVDHYEHELEEVRRVESEFYAESTVEESNPADPSTASEL